MTSRKTPYWLWALLTAPALLWTWSAVTSENARIFHILVHPTGEWSARILILTLMITPLTLLFKGKRWPRWLMHNRRYFGVAAFGYALLHTVLYLMDRGTLERVLEQVTQLDIWTGWLAFFIFIPLAATSADYFVRKMGPRWKALQRWTYAAAVLTLVHWAALHNWESPGAAIVHFAPLAALTLYRLWWLYLRPRPARTA